MNPLDTLVRLGTPLEIRTAAEEWKQHREAIKGQDYKPEREMLEFEKADVALKAKIDAWKQAQDSTVDQDVDVALRGIEESATAETAIPGRPTTMTDSERHLQLSRILIDDTRAAARAARTATDVQLIFALTDTAQIEGFLADAMLTKDAETIRRIGLATETQLTKLAGLERTKGASIGGPASRALLRASEQLRSWREAQHNASPSVKRQRVMDEANQRRMQIQNTIQYAVRGLGLEEQMKKLQQQEKVAKAREMRATSPIKPGVIGQLAFR